MRTITLDDDVAARVDEEVQKGGDTFEDTVARLLRLGLEVSGRAAPIQSAFVVRARPLNARTGVDFDCIGRLLEELELSQATLAPPTPRKPA